MIETFQCQKCGQTHKSGWPSLTYSSPYYFSVLSTEDQNKIAIIDTDFCVIKHEDQVHRFIRCVLKQKVIDHCLELEYGLWVSLSEKSFQDYLDHYDDNHHEVTYFGWLANFLPEYKNNNGSIPMTVYTQAGNSRPMLIPHENHDHAFVYDFYHGITHQEAKRRIQNMLEGLA